MIYSATFVGRKIGTIGCTYPQEMLIDAEDDEEARLHFLAMAYRYYEHISNVVFRECPSEEIPNKDT